MRAADGADIVQNDITPYGPFGESAGAPPAGGGGFGYTGRQWDAETGLYYVRARYYSPRLGRFLQLDPMGTKDDPNAYLYVGNDPLNATDPTGEQARPRPGIFSPFIQLVVPGTDPRCPHASAAGCPLALEMQKLWDKYGLGPRSLSDDGESIEKAGDRPRTRARNRREEQRARGREERYGDPDYEEPASEDYAKWRARDAEKRGGREERRRGHDEKRSGEPDRTRDQIDEDYKSER